MLFFYIFGFVCLSNAIPLASMDKVRNVSVGTGKSDLLTSLMSNPKQLVEEMQNLNPEKLQNVITLLRELKASSIAEKKEFVDDLSAKNTALDAANGRVIQKEKAVSDANDDVTAAQGALTAAEQAASVAETELTSERAVQAAKQSEKDASQTAHDKEVPSLNEEQRILTEVIESLSGLPDAHVTVLHQADLTLEQGKLITTLATLPKAYVVSFDVKANSYVNSWQSVVHFSADGENAATYGSRNPAVWFNHVSKTLHICSAINGNLNTCYNSAAIAEGEWTHIQIAQTDSGAYTIELNGEEVQAWQNNDAREFTDVRVYAADPWYTALDGVISNFQVTL